MNLTISDLRLHNEQLLETSKNYLSDITAANNLNLEMKKNLHDLTKECKSLRSDLVIINLVIYLVDYNIGN